MQQQTQIFKSILKGAEVTVKNKKAYLNKYKDGEYQEISGVFVGLLILLDIIELDSGNFETHEEHYRLKDNFYSIMDNIKTIHLKRIGKSIKKYESVLGTTTPFIELTESYEKIKLETIRKQKLEKINNGSRKDL